MQTISHDLKKEEVRNTKGAIITFLSLATLVFAAGFYSAYSTHTRFLIIELSVQVALSAIAVVVAFKVFKH